MKTVILALTIVLSSLAHAIEPDYTFPIVGEIEEVRMQSRRIVVKWNEDLAMGVKLPVRYSVLYIRWGDGDFFTRVVKVRGNVVTLDYIPVSNDISTPAIIRLVYR